MLESLKKGFSLDQTQGTELIDVKEITTVALPGSENKVEFAQDADGIYFARIEDGKYYPINTKPSERLLEKARHNEQLAGSFWRRTRAESYEMRYGDLVFRLVQSEYDFNDALFLYRIVLTRVVEKLMEAVKNSNTNSLPL